MRPSGYNDCGINLTEVFDLAAVLDSASELKFVHVSHVSRVELRVDLEKVVGPDSHVSANWPSLLVLPRPVDDFDLLLDNAVVAEGDVSPLCYDLALWMYHAVLSKADFALDVSLLGQKQEVVLGAR